MSEKKSKFIRYDDVVKYEILYEKFKRSTNGKRDRYHVIKYQQDAIVRLLKLTWKLENRTYKPRTDYIFRVYEPKERIITANRFEDKIVQRLISENVLEPLLCPRMIHTNYASQPGKGTHVGIKTLTKHLHSYYINHGLDGYILQCDISKYFNSINRTKLVEMISKLPIDDDLIELQKTIIYHTNPDSDTGICIGYQCSQWYAVYYLDALDRYIKEVLHIKYYGRYMDDFYLIHEDKEYLKYCKMEIIRILDELGLKLNKKTDLFPIKNGITFLGFRQRMTSTGKIHIFVRKDSIVREKRRIKKYRKDFDNGKMSRQQVLDSIQSYHAHMNNGTCQSMLHTIDMYFAKVFSDLIYPIDPNDKKDQMISRNCRKIGNELAIYPRDENGFYKMELIDENNCIPTVSDFIDGGYKRLF